MKRGFTLVELLVVLAIIDLLISVMLPALAKARAQARQLECASILRQWGQAYFIYAAQNDGVIPHGGDVPTPLSLDAAAFASMTRHQARVTDKNGQDQIYAGVPLVEILQRAGVPVGKNQMHGPHLALYVLAQAKDGYRVVYALAELDPGDSKGRF